MLVLPGVSVCARVWVCVCVRARAFVRACVRARARMHISTTVYFLWGWIDDYIIYPIQCHLRWRAEQRRLDSGKAV
jgi:hypothetical protein